MQGFPVEQDQLIIRHAQTNSRGVVCEDKIMATEPLPRSGHFSNRDVFIYGGFLPGREDSSLHLFRSLSEKSEVPL